MCANPRFPGDDVGSRVPEAVCGHMTGAELTEFAFQSMSLCLSSAPPAGTSSLYALKVLQKVDGKMEWKYDFILVQTFFQLLFVPK